MKKIIAYSALCLFYIALWFIPIVATQGLWNAIGICTLAFAAVTGLYFVIALAIDQCELHWLLLLEKCECEPKWKPVSKLPADGWYLVTAYHKKSKHSMICECKLTGGKWQGYKNRRVTHWCELPEFPVRTLDIQNRDCGDVSL